MPLVALKAGELSYELSYAFLSSHLHCDEQQSGEMSEEAGASLASHTPVFRCVFVDSGPCRQRTSVRLFCSSISFEIIALM